MNMVAFDRHMILAMVVAFLVFFFLQNFFINFSDELFNFFLIFLTWHYLVYVKIHFNCIIFHLNVFSVADLIFRIKFYAELYVFFPFTRNPSTDLSIFMVMNIKQSRILSIYFKITSSIFRCNLDCAILFRV